RGRLSLKRLLRLVEEARIFDGDHGLVGESLKKPRLCVGKGPDFGATHGQRADGDAVSHEGNNEHCPMPVLERDRLALRELRRFGFQVRDVDGAPLQHRAAVDSALADRHRELAHRLGWNRTVMRHEAQTLAFAAKDLSVARRAQPTGVLDDRVEDRLNVGGRTREYAQGAPFRGPLLKGPAPGPRDLATPSARPGRSPG